MKPLDEVGMYMDLHSREWRLGADMLKDLDLSCGGLDRRPHSEAEVRSNERSLMFKDFLPKLNVARRPESASSWKRALHTLSAENPLLRNIPSRLVGPLC